MNLKGKSKDELKRMLKRAKGHKRGYILHLLKR